MGLVTPRIQFTIVIWSIFITLLLLLITFATSLISVIRFYARSAARTTSSWPCCFGSWMCPTLWARAHETIGNWGERQVIPHSCLKFNTHRWQRLNFMRRRSMNERRSVMHPSEIDFVWRHSWFTFDPNIPFALVLWLEAMFFLFKDCSVWFDCYYFFMKWSLWLASTRMLKSMRFTLLFVSIILFDYSFSM